MSFPEYPSSSASNPLLYLTPSHGGVLWGSWSLGGTGKIPPCLLPWSRFLQQFRGNLLQIFVIFKSSIMMAYTIILSILMFSAIIRKRKHRSDFNTPRIHSTLFPCLIVNEHPACCLFPTYSQLSLKHLYHVKTAAFDRLHSRTFDGTWPTSK